MATRASSYLEDFRHTATNSITDSNSSSGSKSDLLGATSSLSLDENISRDDIGESVTLWWELAGRGCIMAVACAYLGICCLFRGLFLCLCFGVGIQATVLVAQVGVL